MMTVPSQVRDFVEWHGGCTHALVWAIEADHPEICDLVAAARHRLEPIVAPRYERQPHITLAYAGLAPTEGAIPGGELYLPHHLERDIAALREVLPARMGMTVDGWGSFSMAPYLRVDAPGAAGLRATLGSPPVDYVPHVTIGLFSVAVPMAEVIRRMTGWSVDPVRIDVTAVSLLSYETHDVAGPLTRVGRLRLDDGSWTLAP